MTQETILTAESSGERLDRFISDRLPVLSRASVQRLIEEGNILVDGRERIASYRVQTGETIGITVPPPEPASALPEAIPLDIIYEDEDLMVVNKPAGMVVHPAAGHVGGTLVNAVLAHAPGVNVGGEERPGIVHRLDADTSGLIIVAKNDNALRFLQDQFKKRSVHKRYLALVEGQLTPPRGRIVAPIGRDPKHRQRMAVVTSGGRAREAVTVYRTVSNFDGYTLVEAEPLTGRTHQIRVHFAFMGFPIVGDMVYGKKKKNRLGLTRQFLHAWRLAFTLPSGRTAEFSAPLPEDLRAVLEQLGFDAKVVDKAGRPSSRPLP
jgi:23S rRNA pseudouridine1911/1915/1917 synthase